MGTSTPAESTRDDRASAALIAVLQATLDRTYPPGTLVRRDAHPKHHGVVRATWIVDPAISPELRHGVFAVPGQRFPCWIRFSNGSPVVQPDRVKDQRGMAIKLVGVPGEKLLPDEREAVTQDFVLASASTFFLRRPDDYPAFAAAVGRKPAFRVLGFFFGLNPFRWRVHEFRALTRSLQRTTNLLAIPYFSQVPFRLGPHVVKYVARPVGTVATPPHGTGADFLRDALAAHLAAAPARFEFFVQRRPLGSALPIDDATVEWPEAEAPLERVASIEIPPQAFESPEQMALAEQLSFTPWHSLPAHEPLGAVNATRRTVYEALSRHRHARNHVPRVEPTSMTLGPGAVSEG